MTRIEHFWFLTRWATSFDSVDAVRRVIIDARSYIRWAFVVMLRTSN